MFRYIVRSLYSPFLDFITKYLLEQSFVIKSVSLYSPFLDFITNTRFSVKFRYKVRFVI